MNTLSYHRKLLRSFPGAVTALFASTQLEIVVSSLSAGYIMRGYINHLNGLEINAFGIQLALLLLVAVYLVSVAGVGNWMYWNIRLQRHGMALICLNIMERIFKRPGALPLPDDTQKGRPISEGQCLNTLSHDTMTIPGMISFLFEMLGLCTSGLIAFWIMLRISAPITLLVFFPLAAIFLLLNRLRSRIEPLEEKARRSAGEVSTMIADMFNCIQTVKTSAAEEYFIAEFERRNGRRLKDAIKAEFLFTMLRGLNSGLMEFGAGLILLACASAMYRGTFSTGDFMLFTAYLWPVLGIFRWGGMFLAEVKRNNVAIKRMEALMHPEKPGAPVRHRELSLHSVPSLSLHLDRRPDSELRELEVCALAFRYTRHKHDQEDPDTGIATAAAAGPETVAQDTAQPFAISDISFRLCRGSLTVITGTIGSGKSTLVKCLIGLLPTDSGSIYWNRSEVPQGSDLSRDDFWQAPRCAYTPQVPRLFSETLQENILLGMNEQSCDLQTALNRACLEADLKEMPEGLATPIGPRGVRLSGGQVQRTAAARMFARDASLMVLDDISSALDVETEQQLWDRLRAEGDGKTYLVVSHREALLRRADQILLLDSGRLADSGTFSDLEARSALFRSLLRERSGAGDLPPPPELQAPSLN
ncbi:MAG: ABC transporter ATP-binding protein/permease [Spirochaetes bacterium]|nr:ABC transporter ATP-binding protein/permease [Spirochaetota bacterium]MBU0955105.1 ABC transporter ATP-binding protein/permease [Spirochaetota bacterium]